MYIGCSIHAILYSTAGLELTRCHRNQWLSKLTCTCKLKPNFCIQQRMRHFITSQVCLGVLIIFCYCYALNVCWIITTWTTSSPNKLRITARSHWSVCLVLISCVTALTTQSAAQLTKVTKRSTGSMVV